MAKDPAFLFYPGDWLGGTMRFSRSHKGAYMDLLMAQFHGGRLALSEIITILGIDFDSMWESTLKAKFKQDEKGLFYNERLDFEQNKRKKFSESRRNNLTDKKDNMESHINSDMENKNENKDKTIIKNISIEERKIIFIEEVTKSVLTDDIDSLNAFSDYWTESNLNGKKMRFEMQKVFDYKRRFSTWLSNNKKWNNGTEITKGNREQRQGTITNLKNLSEAILDDHSSKNS